jgi:membrane protease YdiL (CAAX protease family)
MVEGEIVLITNAVISAVLQVLLFTAIPFLIYLIAHRRAKGFFEYIGLHKPARRTMLYATALSAAFLLPTLLVLLVSPYFRAAATAPNTVMGQLRFYGFSGTSVILVGIKALVQTSFSEEILFRGFVAKRLIAWLGFGWGNLLQALIFGAVHLLLFTGQAFSLPLAVGFVLLTGAGGWISAYLNECIGNGSILPGWWMHGLANVVADALLAFG